MEKFWERFQSLIDQNILLNLFSKTLLSLIVLIVFLVLARVLRTLVRQLTDRTSKNANLPILLSNLIYVLVLSVGGVTIVSIYTETGFSTVLTLLGLLSLAISLSVQDVLKNFVSGVYLLLEQPFSIGDRVRVRDVEGKVENIEIRTTTIHTDDGVLVYIPNSIVFSEVVTNRTYFRQRLSTVWITFSPENMNLEEASSRIHKVVDGLEPAKISVDPPAQVLVESVNILQITVKLEFWSPISAPPSTTSDLITALMQELPGTEIRGAAAITKAEIQAGKAQ